MLILNFNGQSQLMVSFPWCSHHVEIDCVSDVLEKNAGSILGMCRRRLIRVFAGSTCPPECQKHKRPKQDQHYGLRAKNLTIK